MAQINWIERYPDEHSRIMVKDAYDTVVKLELLDEIKNLNPQMVLCLLHTPLLIKFLRI